MNYRHIEGRSFEDYSSGRVILSKSGLTNFPVRLAGEIIGRCIEHLARKEGLTIYDPCCGGGYLLTIAGMLYPQAFAGYIGTDIDETALEIGRDNLALLTPEGLEKRREHLEKLYNEHGRQSHADALVSCDVFERINNSRRSISICLSKADCLSANSPVKVDLPPDIVIADVPYSDLTEWQSEEKVAGNPLDILFRNLTAICTAETVAAVICDKSQRVSGEYSRLEKFQIGKRRVWIGKIRKDEKKE